MTKKKPEKPKKSRPKLKPPGRFVIETTRLKRMLSGALMACRGGMTSTKFQAVHFRATGKYLDVVATNGYWMYVWREKCESRKAALTISEKVAERMLAMAIEQKPGTTFIIDPAEENYLCEFGRLVAQHVRESDAMFDNYQSIVEQAKHGREKGRELVGLSAFFLKNATQALVLAADDATGGRVDVRVSFGDSLESPVILTSSKAPEVTIYIMQMKAE